MKTKKHGLSNTRLYTIWHSMYGRCYYKSTHQYKNYGGKGIKVCDEWKNDFMSFYNWAMANGYRDDLTIDRIDVNGNYEPSNCRWATYKEQSRNRTTNRLITYKGKTKTLTEWSEIYDIDIVTLSDRLKTKISFEDAITKPVYKGGGYLVFTINNKTKTLSDWCKIYNISYERAYTRIKHYNWDILKALKTPVKEKAQSKLYELKGKRKTLFGWTKIYDINYSTLKNRINSGLSLEEALKKEKNQQYASKIYTIGKERHTLKEWANIKNIKYSTVLSRIKKGENIKDALNNKSQCCNYYTYKNMTKTTKDWANYYDMSYELLRSRLKAGWTIERALNTPLKK